MGRKRLIVPQGTFAALLRNTCSNLQPILSGLSLPTLPHPALSHPAEPDVIHNSLDLSFQQAISVSRLDRELIDKLTHTRCTHLQLS
jgi:hypothetical protein